ncbi:MAG: magnesium transporter CorA family protein [Sphingomicrobium sp.]
MDSAAMLRTFGPGCEGQAVDSDHELIPARASWIDLESPTRSEEQLVERCIGVDVPTREDLEEIEPSSRLFERGGTIHMTVSALTGVTEGEPTTEPIAFVLTAKHLVTLRYSSPKAIRAFIQAAHHDRSLVRDPMTALVKLVDALIDRVADELEELGDEIELISRQIFDKRLEARRIPADKLTALLTSIGLAQTLLAKIRYSAVSMRRMLNFLGGSTRMQGARQGKNREHLASLTTDIVSLSEHANFQADHLIFLLDACLGLISVEQNAAMKLFSWAAVVFLPPTLIAGIYGMNFDYFPELKWHYGYFVALLLMLASAVLPYLYFRWRRWI